MPESKVQNTTKSSTNFLLIKPQCHLSEGVFPWLVHEPPQLLPGCSLHPQGDAPCAFGAPQARSNLPSARELGSSRAMLGARAPAGLGRSGAVGKKDNYFMFWCSSSATAILPCPSQHSSSSHLMQHRTEGEGIDGRWPQRWHYPESNRGKHPWCNHLPLFLTLFKIATLLVFLTFSFMTSWSGFGTCPPPGTANVRCWSSSL